MHQNVKVRGNKEWLFDIAFGILLYPLEVFLIVGIVPGQNRDIDL